MRGHRLKAFLRAAAHAARLPASVRASRLPGTRRLMRLPSWWLGSARWARWRELGPSPSRGLAMHKKRNVVGVLVAEQSRGQVAGDPFGCQVASGRSRSAATASGGDMAWSSWRTVPSGSASSAGKCPALLRRRRPSGSFDDVVPVAAALRGPRRHRPAGPLDRGGGHPHDSQGSRCGGSRGANAQ